GAFGHPDEGRRPDLWTARRRMGSSLALPYRGLQSTRRSWGWTVAPRPWDQRRFVVNGTYRTAKDDSCADDGVSAPVHVAARSLSSRNLVVALSSRASHSGSG